MLATLIERTESHPTTKRRHYADKYITLQTTEPEYNTTKHRYNKSMIESDISLDSVEYKQSHKKHIQPQQHTQPHIQSKKQFVHIKHKIDTTEQTDASAFVRLNKSIQQSTAERSFEHELGGRITRLSESQLQTYLTSAYDANTMFLQKSDSEKYEQKLQQYIQHTIQNNSKQPIDVTPNYDHTVEQRTVQQYIHDVNTLPTIQYTVEPFVVPVTDSNDKGKNKKSATKNKDKLAKTLKSTVKQSAAQQVAA